MRSWGVHNHVVGARTARVRSKTSQKRIEFGEMMEVQRKEGRLRKKAWTPEELKAWSDLDSLEQDLHRIKSQQLRLEKKVKW